MKMHRRSAIMGGFGLAVLAGAPPVRGETGMYGLIGKMTAIEGQRGALTDILLRGLGRMPGCLSYIVAHDPVEADAIWVTEVWTDEDAHRASLQVPEVKAAIQQGMPLIATFSDAQVTVPIGGVGLVAA